MGERRPGAGQGWVPRVRSAVLLGSATVLVAGVALPARAFLPGELPLLPPAAALCGSAAGAPEVGGESGSLRVATYNILHTQDSDGLATIEQRIGMLTTAIADADVDVVGLQEVTRSGNHGLVIERLAEGLAELTSGQWNWCWFASNPHVHYEPEPQPGGGGGPLTELAAAAAGAQTGNGSEFREGLAVLSRLPIAQAAVTRLPLRAHEAVLCIPPDPLGCNLPALLDSRVLMSVRLVTAAGELDFFTTHLANSLTVASDDTKLRQVRAALDIIDDTAGLDRLPDLFVGDFNSVEGDERHDAVLARGFLDTFRDVDPTADGFTGGQDVVGDERTASERIDFVFARPGVCSFEVSESTVFGDQPAERDDGDGLVWPSDHFGVVSELSIPESQSEPCDL